MIAIKIPIAISQGYKDVYEGGVWDWSFPKTLNRKGRVQENGLRCPTITGNSNQLIYFNDISGMEKTKRPDGKGWCWNDDVGKWFRVRKLTPRECFRLMDVSEKDIDKIQESGVSNSQMYKMAGNSIVVGCLEEIFEQIFYPQREDGTLF